MAEDPQTAIREALAAVDITQRDLAERMGVTEGRVSQLLGDDSNPTWGTMEAIAKASGLRVHVRFCRCSGGFVCTPCKESTAVRVDKTQLASMVRAVPCDLSYNGSHERFVRGLLDNLGIEIEE
jgi:transcriptional regulator with XRE-family HTH domain